MIDELFMKIKIERLSKEDKAAISRCKNCIWLKKIDYKRLKIYCVLPRCEKGAKKIES